MFGVLRNIFPSKKPEVSTAKSTHLNRLEKYSKTLIFYPQNEMYRGNL